MEQLMISIISLISCLDMTECPTPHCKAWVCFPGPQNGEFFRVTACCERLNSQTQRDTYYCQMIHEGYILYDFYMP